MIKREIPKNIEAEEAVLGSILINQETIYEVSELLDIEDFYRKNHRTIFKAMLNLSTSKKAIDIITLTNYLTHISKLEEVGGIVFVTSLANKVPSTANLKHYINIVKEKSMLRNIINIAEHMESMSYDNEQLDTPEVILDKTEQMISRLTKKMIVTKVDNIQGQTLKAYMDIENIINHKDELLGLETGLYDLDNFLQGLKNSDFMILAARPSMGKTAFALNIASHLSIKKDTPVVFFSLEMSSNQLIHRIFSSRGLIPLFNLKSGNLDDAHTQKLIKVSNKLSQSKLLINDEISNLMSLRSIARKLKRENDIKLIIIDYLQLLEGTRRENRNLEISEISRSLKILAKELDIPIIALSQLSRSVESRQVKKPMLSDLRESGSLEQDADIVMFLYREDYYNPETENKNITDVIIAKNRNGPTGTIPVYFHKEYVRFQDLAKD
ncbi:replicative DNA helicase [Megamonas funiformis]|uniref:Replicative DNA helicase n=1 Tax=Megamonas funiformis TaxID=437897 RepID=A0AAW4U4F8_9FIRM|nr:replicative DNA helicase [Megamonas funiformis]MCB6827992.1 replicative DNA helicase [Megamonas funiformis]